MRTIAFLTFFSIALLIYFGVNFYIGIRGYQALQIIPGFKPAYLIVFSGLMLTFIVGRFLERIWLNPATAVITWIGAIWLAAMCYFLFCVIILDLLRLVNHFTHFYPAIIVNNYEQVKLHTGLLSFLLVAIIVIAGLINAFHPRIKNIDIKIGKTANDFKELNVVMVSDVHLGTIVGKRRVAKLVAMINSLNPDIVLFAGDIIDEDVGPVIKYNLGEALRNIRAQFGIFTAPGNHEYIGGSAKSLPYLEEHNVSVLEDSMVLINDSFYIIGRADVESRWFTGYERKPLRDLMADIDRSLPVILLDHQPAKLNESMIAGVDLQLSGHTHHGQLFPFNFITQMIFEVSYGLKKKGNTNIYVSSGFGTWGPPIRTSARPEIVNIHLIFD